VFEAFGQPLVGAADEELGAGEVVFTGALVDAAEELGAGELDFTGALVLTGAGDVVFTGALVVAGALGRVECGALADVATADPRPLPGDEECTEAERTARLKSAST